MHLLKALLILTISVIAAVVYAVPTELSHQGRLLDSNGQPLGGSFDITYRLFDVEAAGTALWEETQLVTVDDGLFSVRLGTTVPLDIASFGIRPDSLWLEIQVGGDTPISPRTKLTATPVSVVATGLRGDLLTSPGELIVQDTSGKTVITLSSVGDRVFFYPELPTAPNPKTKTSSITNGGLDTTTVVEIGGTTSGGYMMLSDSTGDTTVIIDGHVGGGGRIVVQAEGINGLGESVKDRFTVTGYGVVGENFILDGGSSQDYQGGVIIVNDSISLVDSNGVTRTALKKGDRIALVGFGSFSASSPPDTAFAIDTLGNAQFLGGSPTGHTFEIAADATSIQAAIVDSTGTPAISLVDDSGPADTQVVIKKGRIEFVDPFGNVVASYAVPGLILTDTPYDTTVAIDSLGNAEFAGYVTVGSIDPQAALTVAGEICATGTIGACSDARYKTDIAPISTSLDRVMLLRGVTYRWKQDKYPDYAFDERQHVGFIAQEVEPLFPEVVMTDDRGYKSIDYSRLTPVLVEAVKEQQAQIKSQQQQIDDLKKMVQQLATANQRSNPNPSSDYYAMGSR